MRSLLVAAKGDKLEALYVLAITTGMRQGELLGLMWKDIDLNAGTLKVNRSVYDGVISPPKTSAGRRTIRLSKLAIAALKQHKINAAKLRISEWVSGCTHSTGPAPKSTSPKEAVDLRLRKRRSGLCREGTLVASSSSSVSAK